LRELNSTASGDRSASGLWTIWGVSLAIRERSRQTRLTPSKFGRISLAYRETKFGGLSQVYVKSGRRQEWSGKKQKGIMECWNDGKMKNLLFDKPIIPIFHSSNIP
jgi:hypothetical protein